MGATQGLCELGSVGQYDGILLPTESLLFANRLEHGQAQGHSLAAAIDPSFATDIDRSGGCSPAENHDGVQITGIDPVIGLEADRIGGFQSRQQPRSPAESVRRGHAQARRLADRGVGVRGC